MIVKQRRFTDVTHLPNSLDCPLPHNTLVLGEMDRETFPLLLDHVTELVADEAEDVLGLLDGHAGRGCRLVGPPQRLLRLRRVAMGVEVTGNGEGAAASHS